MIIDINSLRKATILIFFILLGTSIQTYAQNIGWNPIGSDYTLVNHKEWFKNRIHYTSYSSRNFPNIKDEKLEIMVKQLGINEIVKKKMPDFKSILTQKLLDNGLTISNSAYNQLILEVESFTSHDVVSFCMRLYLKKYYVRSIPGTDNILDKILWENIVFGFVKENNTVKIKDYFMDCVSNLIEDLNKDE